MAIAITVDAPAPSEPIPIRSLSVADLSASLRDGWADFSEKRGDLIFIGILYPLIGLVAAVTTTRSEALPVLFPLVAGLSLLGPLVSTGFYELARRREAGLESSWWHFFDVLKRPSLPSIMFVGAVLIGIFGAWMASAVLVYVLFLGTALPPSLGAFVATCSARPGAGG